MDQQPSKKRRSLRLFLKVLAVLAVLGLLLGVGSVINIQNSFTDSLPYQGALRALAQDPRAVQQLGTPLEAGWFSQGTLTTTTFGSSGYAKLHIPVHGPQGSATLHMEANVKSFNFSERAWVFTNFALEPEGTSAPIDLPKPDPIPSAGVSTTHAYKAAVSLLQNHPTIPIHTGAPVTHKLEEVRGSYSLGGDDETASIALPLHGPKIKGNKKVSLALDCKGTQGVWSCHKAELLLKESPFDFPLSESDPDVQHIELTPRP